MTDIEKRARAIWLLMVAHRDAGLTEDSDLIRLNISCRIDHSAALSAIEMALTPPEGFVLVPVEPTKEMMQAGGWQLNHVDQYKTMLAARPEEI